MRYLLRQNLANFVEHFIITIKQCWICFGSSHYRYSLHNHKSHVKQSLNAKAMFVINYYLLGVSLWSSRLRQQREGVLSGPVAAVRLTADRPAASRSTPAQRSRRSRRNCTCVDLCATEIQNSLLDKHSLCNCFLLGRSPMAFNALLLRMHFLAMTFYIL